MDPQLFISQAADLKRPSTHLEVETKLATPKKSGWDRSSSSKGPLPNARAGDGALAVVWSELHDFQDIVNMEFRGHESHGEATYAGGAKTTDMGFGTDGLLGCGRRHDPSNR